MISYSCTNNIPDAKHLIHHLQTYGIILIVKIVLYFHPHGSASWIQVVDGVKEITSHANWHVQEVNVRPTQKNLNELRAFWKPIGAIVDAGAGANKLSEADLESFPVVFIDHDPATLPANSFSVCHDSAATATLAAKELLSTGFEHFAYVPFPEKRFWDEEREAAFRKAVEINGMPCSVFRPAKTTGSDSVAHLRLLREFIAGLPRPCGVFAANDRTAEDVLTVARMLGLNIPQDLSVIGVDNYLNICENSMPTLTSVEPDFRRAGAAAALLMMEITQSNGRFTGDRKRLYEPLRIVRRESTRILMRNDAEVTAALEMIKAKACTGLTAAQVVQLFPCSRVYAEMRFRKATGKSILEAIQEVRLERAKELLLNPNQQLKSIADFCGLRSQNALCKFFQTKTGMTMSAWRAEHLQSRRAPQGE